MKTNYGKQHYLCNGNDKKGYRLKLSNFNETEEDMLKRLTSCGYTYIMFYEVSTMVRGYHDLIAYCK